MRIKAASPQEREQLLEQLIQIGDGLTELDALPPDPERLVFAADRAGFGMKTTPELLETLLTEAAATVTSAADAALAETAAANAALPRWLTLKPNSDNNPNTPVPRSGHPTWRSST